MNSVEIYIVVEGQTEQTFVRDVLAPQLAHKGIYLYSAFLGKPGHKGGDVRFDRAKVDIGNFLKQRNHTYISTMFDYYRIDVNWPGRADVRQSLGGQVFYAYTISVNVDEEIGGRLRVAGYREGGGGYCNQSGIRYDKQLRLDKTLKIYLVTVTGQGGAKNQKVNLLNDKIFMLIPV